MKPRELWMVLLDKAAQDEQAVDQLLQFPDLSSEVIAFHLQQAAEKMIKAVLGAHGISYRFTHNLGDLIHLLENSQTAPALGARSIARPDALRDRVA